MTSAFYDKVMTLSACPLSQEEIIRSDILKIIYTTRTRAYCTDNMSESGCEYFKNMFETEGFDVQHCQFINENYVKR